MRRTATAQQLSPRGVERRTALSAAGYPVLLAVTSDGRCVDELEVRPHMDVWQAIEELRAKLDAVDPVAPSLRLVKPRLPMSPANFIAINRIGLRIQARGF